jgi:hypothetical protein
MHRWRDYFHGLIASARAATTELVSGERAVTLPAHLHLRSASLLELAVGVRQARLTACATVQLEPT